MERESINTPISLQKGVPLAPLTKLSVGGAAKFFVLAKTIEEITAALLLAEQNSWRVAVLGGGSNTLVSDAGFDGLVIQIATTGIIIKNREDYAENNSKDVVLQVAAGEYWEPFVDYCVGQGFAGIECLTGIPGCVGAVPVQNVGAYGCEVADVISRVQVLDRHSQKKCWLTHNECAFSYRNSRFKTDWQGRYIITQVEFILQRASASTPHYPALTALLPASQKEFPLATMQRLVRQLRGEKSMLYDITDPNHRSAGSFFVNPIVPRTLAYTVAEKLAVPFETMPCFATDSTEPLVKLSAAWLISHSGFKKGYVHATGRVGLSSQHVLALINLGGASAQDLLDFEKILVHQVFSRTGITLKREPVLLT